MARKKIETIESEENLDEQTPAQADPDTTESPPW